mmetsp:Transcript_10084/g.14233  ORF Transcript_10084/g.14233 Transcript_10084/m.14233 type:complete len:371 (+) Transcript_10084:90-1202(+)
MGKGGENIPKPKFLGKRCDALGRKITLQEVKTHRTPEDAWMVHNNKVYDVSNWHDHPGGHVIFTHAGDDFTDIFAAFHPSDALRHLENFYIGELAESSIDLKPEKQKNFEKAYRELRSKLIVSGMFKSNKMYYAYKCLSNLMIWAFGCLCVLKSDSFSVHMFGAFLLALFWQQCGWLSHDFLHHQVFKNRTYGDYAGVFWGNVCQGFSVGWWKNKHNTHHAVPNLHESCPDAHDGDPDIDTMPVLAWSLKMASTASSTKLGQFFVKYQSILYFPILLIARISWLMQSFTYAFGLGEGIWESKGSEDARRNFPLKNAERLGLLVHYLWLGSLIFGNMSLFRGLAFFLSFSDNVRIYVGISVRIRSQWHVNV